MEWDKSGCLRPQANGQEARRMVVVVDDVKPARAALRWAMLNVVRRGDIITLLHVHPSIPARSSSSAHSATSLLKGGAKVVDRTRRLLRLKGYQLALSFKELCDRQNPEARVEIIVVEGDQGPTIVSVTKKLKASAIILGQHRRGLLWRILGKEDTPKYCMKHSDCLVLAVKQDRKQRRLFTQCKMASQVEIL